MMKKTVVLGLALILVFALAACGGIGKTPSDDTSSSAPESSAVQQPDSIPEESVAEALNIDFRSIFAGGEQADTVYGDLTPAQKQEIINAGKEEGVDVSFGTDGSMTAKNADGSVVVQKPDGTWSINDAEGGEGQYGGNWPDNKYTKLIPKPDFELAAAFTDEEEGFSVVFASATLEQIKAYVEKVKAKGFTVNAQIEEQEMMGMVLYTYSADNASGNHIEIFSTAGSSGLSLN